MILDWHSYGRIPGFRSGGFAKVEMNNLYTSDARLVAANLQEMESWHPSSSNESTQR